MKTPRSAAEGGLELGRLLRLQAMLTHVGRAGTTFHAGGALVDAHNNLRAELLLSLQSEPLSGLRSECERLFPALPELRHTRPVTPEAIHAFQEETSEAHLSLRRLQGWVEGLINELTLPERLRLEAEARARIERATADGSGARDGADVDAALRARLKDSRGRG